MKQELCDYWCEECRTTETLDFIPNNQPLPNCKKCSHPMVYKWKNANIHLNGADSGKYPDITEKVHPEAYKAHQEGKI
ncbi:MAG: hypothetical protein PHP92_03325 [Candidatus Nanoarchaeia archaeon]|nr:hypothetical protein [Candidatus Nanoarchaeia archaeon]